MLQRNGREATQTMGGGCMGVPRVPSTVGRASPASCRQVGRAQRRLGGPPHFDCRPQRTCRPGLRPAAYPEETARPHARPVRRSRNPATMGAIFRFVFSPRTTPTGVIAVGHSTARSPAHHKTSREEHLLIHVNTNFDRKADSPGRSSSVEPAAGPFCPQRGAYACGFGPERGPCRRNRHKGSGPAVGWPPRLVGSATQSDLSNRREKTAEER